MPFTTFQVWCILFVSHTQLLEPLYQIHRLSFSFSKDSWECSVVAPVTCEVASKTPLTKLIFCFLKAFLRKQNNTHKYTLEIADFTLLTTSNRWANLKTDSFGFTVDVFFKFSVGPYDLFWKLSWRACTWSWTPRFKVTIIHLSFQGT